MIYYTFQKCSPFSFSLDNSHKKNRILIYELFWSKWTTYILRISILRIVIYENCIRFFFVHIDYHRGKFGWFRKYTQQNCEVMRVVNICCRVTFDCFLIKITIYLYYLYVMFVMSYHKPISLYWKGDRYISSVALDKLVFFFRIKLTLIRDGVQTDCRILGHLL